MEEGQDNQEMQQRIHQQQLMIEQQRQEELLRLQQTALVEKQREEQERQMIQRRQEEELFRLQQEALMEKQREEDMMRQRMSAPPPGTAPTVLPPPISVPSTMPASGPGVLPPGIDVSGPPMSGLSGPNMAPPPPQLRGPPPSVAMPPPPGMEPIGMGPPGVGPPGVGPPGVDSDDESRSDRKLPSLLSLKVEPPVEVKEVKLPIALEQALAFKTERAKQVGVQPEDYVKLENIPEAPPAPVISRSGLVDEIDDEDDEDQNQSGRKQKSVQQPEQDQRQSKNKRKKKRKKRAKHRQQELQKQKAEEKKDPDEETGEKEPDVEIEYIQETLGLSELDPMYRQFARIFETFRISEPEKSEDANKDLIKELIKEPELKKVPKLEDEYEEEEEEEEKKEEEKTKLSKRKLKKLTRLSVAELKQLVNRPDVVEMHDVTARDPKLLVQLKAHRNTVPVPRHWCFKRKYLQGKRGIEKPPFDLPDFIKKTGIMEMRAALQEKEDQRTLKAKMRERARPKLGKIDIDYQKLHDAFFKWQTKPRMSIHGDLYYEGKEFETRLKEKKPGDLSEELRTALGMPVGPSANKVPPPWLIAMQRYGPPPSYPNLKIPGLNAPIPEGCSFGYHAGGWGKPPVDETGRPLYGDVFGVQGQDYQSVPEEEEVDRTIWGELESESEEESEEEEEDEEEGEKEDETGLVTPAEGLITPSGITSIPAGMETPEIIELRKRKIESEMEGSETPVLYQVLPEKRMDRVGGAMMASTHIYDMTGAGAPPPGVIAPTRRGGGPEGPGTVELALDPSELDLVDTDAMAVRYEQQIREQQSQLQKEDLSDMLADHVARQKNKRKQRQQHQDNKQAKKYKEFKF
ncbi:splicing factor 3B subunit 2 [Periplaneta americana]|uniref:splicing factor 3B subunit 2 n=1 Tax=Periplaneta americana TaxID=6978 RepID=UPI0037E8BC45